MKRRIPSLLSACAAGLSLTIAATEDGSMAPAAASASASAAPASSEARPLHVSGSSTVAPYALVLSNTRLDAGVRVSSTGTTAGLAALCTLHAGSADLTGASRRIGDDELTDCAAEGVATVVEVPLGRDGIVLAQSAATAPMALTERDLYMALAERRPRGGGDCTLVPNRTRLWSEVRPDLPDRAISVYGPPPTSGTREVFSKQAIAVGARQEACLAALAVTDADAFDAALALRRDGAWVEAGESDGATAYALTRLPEAIGVFGIVHVTPQPGLALLPLSGVMPDAQTIADGRYPLARPLFIYTTAGHLTRDLRVIEVVRSFAADEAVGPEGTLTGMGLAPGQETGQAYLIDTGTKERTALPLAR